MSGARKSKVCRLNEKKTIRILKSSILFYGEGPTEKAFLDYLHYLYSQRKGIVTIHRGNAQGGSHHDIILSALTYKIHSESYDKIYVLLDEDCKNITCEEAHIKAKEKLHKNPERKKVPVECIYCIPHCIEGFFLTILNAKIPQTTDGCKKTFHDIFLSEREKLAKMSYAKIFPLETLERARKTSEALDRILKIFG
jgi:hypothetical protein